MIRVISAWLTDRRPTQSSSSAFVLLNTSLAGNGTKKISNRNRGDVVELEQRLSHNQSLSLRITQENHPTSSWRYCVLLAIALTRCLEKPLPLGSCHYINVNIQIYKDTLGIQVGSKESGIRTIAVVTSVLFRRTGERFGMGGAGNDRGSETDFRHSIIKDPTTIITWWPFVAWGGSPSPSYVAYPTYRNSRNQTNRSDIKQASYSIKSVRRDHFISPWWL